MFASFVIYHALVRFLSFSLLLYSSKNIYFRIGIYSKLPKNIFDSLPKRNIVIGDSTVPFNGFSSLFLLEFHADKWHFLPSFSRSKIYLFFLFSLQFKSFRESFRLKWKIRSFFTFFTRGKSCSSYFIKWRNMNTEWLIITKYLFTFSIYIFHLNYLTIEKKK